MNAERQPLLAAAGCSQARIGALPSGEEIIECRLINHLGTEARVLNLGATLRSLRVADARGLLDDVVLGFDEPAAYLSNGDYFGATIGRYANRIANGRFTLAGRLHQLQRNAGANTEHGGADGFHRRFWHIEGSDQADLAAVTFSLVSPDGDQGFPGELRVCVRYTLSPEDELRIDYQATSSAATVLNLTHHSYWNLAGIGANGGANGGGGDALRSHLRIEADAYTPVDAQQIPTGEIRAVAGTVFDFRTPQIIEARIRDAREPQLLIGRGYDHNFVLRGPCGTLRPVARLEDPRSGRALELSTTEPGLQFYSSNFFSGAVIGKGQRLYRPGDGIALETQHFPDSPNQPHFPSTVLEPGQRWNSSTAYRFLRS